MCINSIITFRNKSEKDIRIYQHFNGYLNGVGKELCHQLRYLLTTYTVEQLQQMLLNLKSGNDVFQTSMLTDIILGNAQVELENSNYKNVNYEYVVDLNIGYVYIVTEEDEYENGLFLSCEEIKRGISF